MIAHPGQDKELTCDVNGTEESTHWQINGSSTLISLSDLLNGAVAGHNRSGRNIVVKDIVMNDDRNGSLYQCVVVATPTMGGKLIILYVAGEFNDWLYQELILLTLGYAHMHSVVMVCIYYVHEAWPKYGHGHGYGHGFHVN